MAFEVLAWNVKDAYSDPYRGPIITSAIEREAPDVVMLSEAYAEKDAARLDDVQEDLYKKGYESLAAPYEDDDDRRDRHGMLFLAHKDLFIHAKQVRLASRNAIRATIIDPETKAVVEIFGMHGDDRSTKSRIAMVKALQKTVEVKDEQKVDWPFLTLGDINEDHGQSAYARALRVARPVAAVLPKQQPNPEEKYNKWLRRVSLADRAGQMAAGRALAELRKLGLRDADIAHQPTIPAQKPRLQLDHILVSSEIHVKGFRVEDYNAAADHGIYQPVSDHRAIAAILQVRQR